MEKQVDIQVGGMTCGNCALAVTNALKKLGAESAVANAATGEVSFTIVNEKNETEYYQEIKALGYSVSEKKHNVEENSPVVHEHYRVRNLFYISLALWVPLMLHMFLPFPILHQPLTQLVLCTPVYLICIYYFGSSAWRSIRNRIPNMDVLVFAGASAAYFYSLLGWYLYPDQVMNYLFFETTSSIVTLVLFGNFLEAYTVSSTAGAIQELMKFQKTTARLVMRDSLGKESIQEIDNSFLRVGDEVQINEGDKVPMDAIVIHGEAFADESMMSGESIPVRKTMNESLVGGSLLVEGHVRGRITAIGSDTVLAHIIRLVNQAQAAKPPLQKLADKISAVFVPLVIAFAIVTFLVNYLFIGMDIQHSMMRTIAVMVIACPCAMGLATPAAVMVGMGRAARNGILIKGGDTLEKLKDIRQFVFDKTGTLTTGKLSIGKYSTQWDDEKFRSLVLAIEQHSSHPIAQCIVQQWAGSTPMILQDIREEKGIGLHAKGMNGEHYQLGSFRLVLELGIIEKHDLFVLCNGQCIGWMDLEDELRPDAREAMQQLHQAGYKTVLLSGDRESKCRLLADELGIQEVYSEKLPAQKMEILDQLMTKMPTAMIGDGINDAPSLARATVGISLSQASQIAMQSAQMLLLKNRLSLLPMAVGLGKNTYSTIRQNLFWAFAYNVVAIPVAAAGLLTPTWGAGIMALSDVVLIVNSLRLRYKKVV